jgi:hypothetical protein
MEKLNSTKYWTGEHFYGTWDMIWETIHSQDFFYENRFFFLKKYYSLTHKYGILLPTLDFFKETNKIEDVVNYIYLKPDEGGMAKWFRLRSMYFVDFLNTVVYPSLIFLYDDFGHIKREILVDVHKTTSINNIDTKWLDEPLYVSASVNNRIIALEIALRSNIFFEDVPYYNEDEKKMEWADNSELAYLNTTRLNSFIREFKNLCFEFGATTLTHYPQRGDIDVSENGVLIKKEIIYYEDIYDLLPNEHKYKPFEEIQVEIDASKYKEYLASKMVE